MDFTLTDPSFRLIPFEQILYCKDLGDLTEIYLSGGAVFLATGSLKKIYAEDLVHHDFMLAGSALLVNCRFIKCVNSDKKTIEMLDGVELPFQISSEKMIKKMHISTLSHMEASLVI